MPDKLVIGRVVALEGGRLGVAPLSRPEDTEVGEAKAAAVVDSARAFIKAMRDDESDASAEYDALGKTVDALEQ